MATAAVLRLDATDTRVAAGVMLAAGAALPLAGDGAGVACPLRALTGVPCPLCGLTTSVVATMQLHLGEALAANPVGVLAVVAAAAALAGFALRIRLPALVVVLVLSAMWLFELHRFSLV
jgi:hypothetical protein